MRKNTLKKAMAVMMSAAMLATGYTAASAEGFTDAETLAEMDAFNAGDEAVYVEEVQPELTQTEVQPEAAQTEEVQAEEAQEEFQIEESAQEEEAFVDGFTDGSAEAETAEFTDGTGEVGEAEETTAAYDFRFENEEVIITAKVFDETALPENAEMNAVKLEAGSEKYEEAKQASIRDLGTTEDDEYTFYDVTFIADGVEIEVPESWKDAEDEGLFTPEVKGGREDVVDFVKNIQAKVNAQEGNSLPVSAFTEYVDGTTPSGSSAYEKRGIAVDIPVWQPENCIQCNRCAYVCPHAVIRPVALTEEEVANAPEGLETIDMVGMPGLKFTMTVSAYDCTGCGSCANVCPGKKGEKALVMKNMEENAGKQDFFDYGREIPVKPEVVAKFKETTVKGSQFKQPLLEFSGACAGCGETPYAKLITQLFGDRMYIANATGCSSIWGNSSPSTPYTVNEKGQGPAWSNSLFEDNAEFGYGMLLAQKALRNGLKAKVESVAASEAASEEVRAACKEWLDTFNCGATNGTATDNLVAALEGADCEVCKDIVNNKDFLAKKSQWIFGGDGWAYDIGFGGVDHVLASGQDINIMVFDTEVYSNTGGQSSKSTKTGAIAQFAAGGKETKKKDLASIAMSYGYVYVAQIAMGADFNQTVKAIAEAEAYPGPSLIIAYAPCINHGIKKGMSKAQTEEQLAVECGYWNNFRFNPAAEGSKFTLDSKAPDLAGYEDFLNGEVRYNALARFNPEKAKVLFAKNEEEAKARYAYLQKLVTLYGSEE